MLTSYNIMYGGRLLSYVHVLCINLQLKREPGSSLMICMRMEEYSFCKYCEHSVDCVCVDAIKDHCSRKETKAGKAGRCMGGSAAGKQPANHALRTGIE